jgi:FUN14 domain-containing protein 1
MRALLKDLSKAPAPKQIGVGAAAGWVSGYLMMKVGKAAATAVGGSLILLQIAHYKGYIKVDWNRMANDTSSLSDRVKDRLRIQSRSTIDKFNDFAKKNIYLAGGFTGGFFIGIASS